MIPRLRHGMVFLCAVIVSGCSTKVVRVEMHADRLDVPVASQLACGYRLGDVQDARADKGQVGGLDAHAFRFENPERVVREQLDVAGWADAGASRMPTVDVQIKHLYLTQNTISKVPVVVYQVAVADGPPFVVRSQKPSMNWNGTQNEAYKAYSRALADANEQLIRHLNSRCPGGS